MNRSARTVIAAVIMAIIAFCVGYGIAPHQPSTGIGATLANPPAGAAIIPVSIVSIRENAPASPTVTVEYPQFPSLPADLNAAIASATMSRLTDFRQEVTENSAARALTASAGDASAALPLSAYSFIASWQPAQIDSAYVSFIERYDAFTGGANEDEELQTFNYDIANKRMMAAADLFPGVSDYLDQISAAARQQLTDSMDQDSDGNVPTDMLDAGTQPTADDFADFTFTDDEITFYFPKYAVAPGSFGEQSVTIPVGSIK